VGHQVHPVHGRGPAGAVEEAGGVDRQVDAVDLRAEHDGDPGRSWRAHRSQRRVEEVGAGAAARHRDDGLLLLLDGEGRPRHEANGATADDPDVGRRGGGGGGVHVWPLVLLLVGLVAVVVAGAPLGRGTHGGSVVGRRTTKKQAAGVWQWWRKADLPVRLDEDEGDGKVAQRGADGSLSLSLTLSLLHTHR
jgi:hypothetical protein